MQEEIKQLRKELEVMKKGNFDTITCKEWYVVDKDGKTRIAATTHASGNAGVSWFDTDQKRRIDASTFANGNAGVQWLYKDGKMRIAALIGGEGTVVLPTMDFSPPKKP